MPEEAPVSAPETPPTPVAGDFLIVPPPFMQRVAVEMALADFTAAKEARDTLDYGMSAKGDKLTFDTWLKELKDLYFGRRESKTVPWKYCSNRSLMIAMAILETLHARLLPAIFNEELTRWRPTNTEDIPKAERIEKLMYWWERVHCKSRAFFDRWARYVIGLGTALVESTWEVRLIDKGETRQPPPIMTPEGGVTVSPPEKVLERVEQTRSDLVALEDVFLMPGGSDLQRDTVILRKRYLYRDLEEMEKDGRVVNVTQATGGLLAALKDKLVVGAVEGEGLTPEQREELQNVKRRNVQVEVLEWWGSVDLDGDTHQEQVRMLVVPEHRLYLGAVAVRDLSMRGLRHLDLTHFMERLDDPTGVRGLGVLEQVKELSLEIDACFNQMTDANSLSVMRPGFYDAGGDVQAAALTLAPNKMTPVSNPQQAVYFPELNIQTERLINAIRLVTEFIERLTAASAYVMGKESEIVGGSGTATRTQEIVNAAGARHSIPIQRLKEGAARILTHHLDLLQKNFPPGLESRVIGESGEAVFENANELMVQGVTGEFDAYLLPDESMGSKEMERQLQQVLYTTLMQNILVASDPAKLYTITADFLKAYGKDPERILGPAPDQRSVDTPEQENTLVLQGEFSGVYPAVTDNHIEHVMKHQALLQDPGFLALPPTLQAQVGEFLTQHIQQHMQMMAVVMQAAQAGGKGAAQPGGADANASGGAAAGGPQAAGAVGPEPGMGAPAGPMGQARATQRSGQSQPPT